MLIGISGLAGSGKDTSADHLVKNHNFVKVSFADPLKRVARDIYDFSDQQLWGPSSERNKPDKRYLREDHERHDWQPASADTSWSCVRCGIRGEDSKDSPRCLVYLTPRFALQSLGTEWGRGCYLNTWVDYALRVAAQIDSKRYGYMTTKGLYQLHNYGNPVSGTAIPDVRFANEIQAIRAARGKLIRVRRPLAGLAGSAGLHASETEQESIPDSDFDVIVINDSSLENLYERIDRLVEGWV